MSKMPVSVSKRRPRTSKKTETEKPEITPKDSRTCSRSILYRVPLTILFLFFIYLWSTSTTVISGNVVHICISSRKLNDLYCLTAGSQPALRVPANNFTKPVSEGVVRSQEEKNVLVLGKDEDKGFANNETFSGERDKSTIGTSLNVIKNETFTGERISILDQDSKPIHEENIDSVLDQDSESKVNEIDHDVLIDWDPETGEERYRYFKSKDEDEETALKAVEKYLQVQRSWLSMGSNRKKPRSCEGQGVYVYDLPSKFNKDLLGECSDMVPWANFCSYFKNDAFGELIETLGKGWFKTHQYSLEPIFHSRVLKHPCRVYDESKAKLFYVPFYGGIDVLRWHFKNVSEDVKDVLAIEVVKWLGSKQSWRKNAGKDHVFVLGKISWDFRRNDKFSWGSSLLEMQEMKNPTKLLIERNPWEANDVAIPHPTYFHPKTDDDIANWQNKIIGKPRRSLISFAGGARPGKPDSIRSILIDQCKSSPNQCRFLNCTAGGCDKPETVIELFRDSEFCLQPPGDSPTRKSIFDSLILGCIPVIFDPYSAYYQYTWHLPEDHRRYSVYINKEDVKVKKVSVIEKLMSKTLREREDMRSYIVHELLPGLVYGDSNAKFERFRDAFDITMDSLLRKITKTV
ncbi:PREDICTED: xyloglucan-specific galacturonosyltransferase 1-like [Camelina sativa]|uniref:Xyloglucan-specific galacturonosyltransferase 1-like n=1 Tax=Camelina sativa TaxID=90675 RepID=A0ABM0TUM0_CAMSA|nr:PREDICTED: xyloglucan-specific galacturonosyltransferase 1-like [Camelina sativa]